MNLQLALEMAMLCEQSYTDDIGGLLADIDVGEGRAIIKAIGNDVLIAFRGTEPSHVKQWLIDFEIEKQDSVSIVGNECEVHKGYFDMLQAMEETLDSVLHHVRQKYDGNVYIGGHSMGGALAAQYANICVSGLITFGQPKTGDKIFAGDLSKYYGENYMRFVNYVDIVPRVPEGFDYAHGGTLYLFDEKGNVSSPADQGGSSIFDLSEDISDHSIDEYIAKLLHLTSN